MTPNQTVPFSTFWNTFHILVKDGVTDFRLGAQVSRSKSQPADDNPSLKGVWSGSCDLLSDFTPHEIFLKWLELKTSNFVHALANRSIIFGMTNCPLNGRGQDHVINFYCASSAQHGICYGHVSVCVCHKSEFY